MGGSKFKKVNFDQILLLLEFMNLILNLKSGSRIL